MKRHKSKVGASYWVLNADYVYVAARYLYGKGLIREFALLGAHAIESYLKAYLIQKTDTFPRLNSPLHEHRDVCPAMRTNI